MTEVIQYEISTLDRFDAMVAEVRKNYAGISISGTDDKAGYKRSKDALAQIKKIKVQINKDRKLIKKPLLAAAAEVEKKALFIIKVFEDIETPIMSGIIAYDKEKERIKSNVDGKLDERLKARMVILNGLGVVSDGVDVSLGDYSCSLTLIRTAEDDYYQEKILPNYKAQSIPPVPTGPNELFGNRLVKGTMGIQESAPYGEPDKSKWTDGKQWEVFLNTLNMVAIPTMKHPRHRARVNKAIKLLTQIKELKIIH